MKTQPKTAVILAAGRGSRRLPITRVIDKAMLPLGNRPTIDYVVEQIVSVGITKIIFIVTNSNSLIKEFYGQTINSKDHYPWLKIDSLVSCEYLLQPINDEYYGTAAALNSTSNHINHNECFLVLPADGFIYNGGPILDKLIKSYLNSSKSHSALVGLSCNSDEIQHYSSISASKDNLLISLIEKPTKIDKSKRYLANISYYIFEWPIFEYIEQTQPVSNEYRLTDTLNILAKDTNILVLPADGEYLDSGQLKTWQKANDIIIKNNYSL